MLFAPAIGIVSFQVLGWLSWLVSGLCTIGIIRNWISPNDATDSMQFLKIAVIFGIGGFVCQWVAGKIRAAADQNK